MSLAMELRMPGLVIPSLIFFEPTEAFLGTLTEYLSANFLKFVDCGAGSGHLTRLLIERGAKGVAIDLYPRDTSETKVLIADAIDFPFDSHSLAIIARPCRGFWIRDTMDAAIQAGAKVCYIGLRKHFDDDLKGLPYARFELARSAGAEGETAFILQERRSKAYGGSMSGGYLKDSPWCVKRKYDDKRLKRPIRVTITKYYGYGVHYYVSLTEESNPFWDERQQCWHSFWNDDGDKPFFDSRRFNTIQEVERFLRRTRALKRFRQNKFDVAEIARNLKWHYKEGD